MKRNIKHKQDKFYTKENIVYEIEKHIDFNLYDLIIEPSAGDGAFLPIIKSYNYIALDIEPENELITKMDWFDFELDNEYKSILVIGNPPFGNQSRLAFNFIKKSTEINAQTIAFILPKSFKKDFYKNRIPLNYNLKLEMDLEDNSFLLNNNDYIVPCIFQIWERAEIKRKKNKLKTKTRYFDFVKKNQNPDLSFRRVGFYAGKISRDIDKSEQSHYFIKTNNNMCLDDIIININKIAWSHNNTVGPRSIGKSDLILSFENIIKKNINISWLKTNNKL